MNTELVQQAAETLARALNCGHRLDRASLLEEALRLNRLAHASVEPDKGANPSDRSN